MSVVGWQMMALRSAQIAQLDVNPLTLNRAVNFLDRTAGDRIGSCYGYTGGNAAAPVSPTSLSIGATTPIGLLCRMYTGWKHEQPGLVMGVQRIESWARPDKGLYFYYYATQVMHHYRGSSWVKWNAWMRDYLVKTQSRQGSETGSWKLSGSHDDAGRLYCTALATMTLEVYYRYSPIYGQQALSSTSLDQRPNTAEETALVP
jgi:hypothetical protein